jgi:KUP system potassium uptake protein
MLMAGVLLLVVGFGSSGNLAAAYGISVTGAMAIDAVLAGLVAAWRWGWGAALAGLVFGAFLLLDGAYLVANALKIPSGGWLPLAIAAGFACTVVAWRRGRRVLHDKLYGHGLTVRAFLAGLDPALHRVPGTAVFMTGHLHVVPMALLHNLRHNKVLHQKVVLVTVRARDVPHVPEAQRLTVERLSKGFWRVVVSHGFMDEPDVPRALGLCRAHALAIDPAQTSYFLVRETLIPSPRPELGPLEERLFMLLSTGNLPATAYFRLPPDQVVELGLQLEI